MRRPTHGAFGTRGANVVIAATAGPTLLEPTLKVARWSPASIGLIIKCATGLWVLAILYVVFL